MTIHEKLSIALALIALTVSLVALRCEAKVSTTDKLRIQKELTGVCYHFNKPCFVLMTNSNKVEAYTTYKGVIVLSKGIRDRLTANELKAVGLHEVGHHVLGHYKRQDIFLSKPHTNFDLVKLRHRHEIEADLFATTYSIYYNEPNYLPQALRTITAPQHFNTTTATHPSYNTRTQVMTNYQNYLTTGQSYRPDNTIYHRPYYLPMRGVN